MCECHYQNTINSLEPTPQIYCKGFEGTAVLPWYRVSAIDGLHRNLMREIVFGMGVDVEARATHLNLDF